MIHKVKFILKGRQILRRFCQLKPGYDENVTNNFQNWWIHWRSKLPSLDNIKVNKCNKSENVRSLVKAEAHRFFDASKDGYGQCSNLRITDKFWALRCSLLIWKSRIISITLISLPRLDLTAATLSIKIIYLSKLIRNELEIRGFEETFCTNVRVVLVYIKNKAKQFKIFVASRTQITKENSNVNQWKYVSTKENSTDDGWRGLDATNSNKVICWFSGPEFPR